MLGTRICGEVDDSKRNGPLVMEGYNHQQKQELEVTIIQIQKHGTEKSVDFVHIT